MKKILFLLLFGVLFSCGSNKPTEEQKEKAKQYIKTLVDAGVNIYGGRLTDANMLVLAVDAYPGANFDIYAQTYLDDAIQHGINVDGVLIVDIKDCQFGDGWVTGKRIGKAYN